MAVRLRSQAHSATLLVYTAREAKSYLRTIKDEKAAVGRFARTGEEETIGFVSLKIGVTGSLLPRAHV